MASRQLRSQQFRTDYQSEHRGKILKGAPTTTKNKRKSNPVLSQPKKTSAKRLKTVEFSVTETKQFLDQVLAQLEDADFEACNKRIMKLNWKLIEIKNKSEAACKRHLQKVLNGIPRYRTLKEVIEMFNKIHAVSKNNANIMPQLQVSKRKAKHLEKEVRRVPKKEIKVSPQNNLKEPEQYIQDLGSTILKREKPERIHDLVGNVEETPHGRTQGSHNHKRKTQNENGKRSGGF